jgi:hypothetical protein
MKLLYIGLIIFMLGVALPLMGISVPSLSTMSALTPAQRAQVASLQSQIVALQGQRDSLIAQRDALYNTLPPTDFYTEGTKSDAFYQMVALDGQIAQINSQIAQLQKQINDIVRPTTPTAATPPTYQLVINSSTGGSTNPAAGAYVKNQGDQVAITAMPASGYNFDHWVMGDGSQSTDNPLILTMTQDYRVTPVFSAIPKPVATSPAVTTPAATSDSMQYVNVLTVLGAATAILGMKYKNIKFP